MKTQAPRQKPERHAELIVPRGCPGCEGPVHLRVTPTTTAAVCVRCHLLARPVVLPRGESGEWELVYGPGGFA